MPGLGQAQRAREPDDADAIAKRAAELGGSVVVAPFDTQISRDAVLADPQGALFSVSTAPGQ